MIFLIEAIVLCFMFHLMIALVLRKKQTAFVNDYPPVVTDKLRSLGLISQKPPAKKKDIIRKAAAIAVYSVLFALLLRNVNGVRGFLDGSLTAYGLWLIVDWYDFIVIDVLCASTDKFYKLAGVSGYDRSAVWFHLKASLRGMAIGVPFALFVGVLLQIRGLPRF